jgi:hypothetical protein
MSEPPDLESLAPHYLDLWLEYLAAAAGNPRTGETRDALLAQLGAARDTFLPTMLAGLMPRMGEAAGSEHGSGPSQSATAAGRGGPRPGAPSATPTSGDGARDLNELHRRLAGVEERLASLERESGGGAKRAGKSPRKRPD